MVVIEHIKSWWNHPFWPSNITDIDRDGRNITCRWCQDSYIFPRDNIFPQCCTLWENIIPWENITLLAVHWNVIFHDCPGQYLYNSDAWYTLALWKGNINQWSAAIISTAWLIEAKCMLYRTPRCPMRQKTFHVLFSQRDDKSLHMSTDYCLPLVLVYHNMTIAQFFFLCVWAEDWKMWKMPKISNIAQHLAVHP